MATDLFDTLLGICEQTAKETDLAATLSMVVQAVARQVPCQVAAIYLGEPNDGHLVLAAVTGVTELPGSAHYLRADGGTVCAAVAAGRPAAVPDWSEHPPAPHALGLPGVASELAVPIWSDTAVIGALVVAAGAPRAFEPEAERVLRLMASILAHAIRSDDLRRREADRAAHEALFAQIGLAVNTTLDPHQVLQQAVDQVGAGLRVDRCVLGWAYHTTGKLTTRYEYLNPLLGERRSLKGERPLAGRSAELLRHLAAGEIVISSERSVHPLLADLWPELSSRYVVRSLIWVPVLAGEPEPEGFFSLRLFQVTYCRHWREIDVSLLRGIAAQLALALRNARLFDAALKSAQQLRDKHEELESFVYTVSHDLQAPAVTVRGFASLLASRHAAQLDERGRGYVERIGANAEYLSQLLNDLLELSRVERSPEPLEPVPVGAVVSEVMAECALDVAQRKVQVDLPPDWPVVLYSRTRLRQVFSNLVSNALKFSGGRPAPRIELGWRRLPGEESAPDDLPRRDQFEFWVKDNGIGIPPAFHSQIFTAFRRLKQIDVPGTGIGLSIVKRIVESRGGCVRLESAPDQGAAFFFTVLAPAQETANA